MGGSGDHALRIGIKMQRELLKVMMELGSKNEPFALATVIQTEGSASAKTGSKAIIDREGKLLLGWVGGGCAESAVRFEALGSLDDGETRVISINLDDEVLGAGMPCGGMMKVFIEPFLPRPELLIVGHGRIAETLAHLGHLMNFDVTVNDALATRHGFATADRLVTSGLGPADMEIGPSTYVVIATQHKGDHLSMAKAIEGSAPYIALIASHKRARLVLDYLVATGVERDRLAAARIHAPAGLDIGARTPEEVALSIISEIVAIRRRGSCLPLSEAGVGGTAGSEPSEETPDAEKLDRLLNTCAPVKKES
jgi:xanthine dehydrogenase accessory factor